MLWLNSGEIKFIKKEIDMNLYDGMLPKEHNKDKRGYYPVMSYDEWEELPKV